MTAPDPIAALARALLYEGFALYPYRVTALKNRQRWFFGGVWPPAWSSANPDEPAELSAQVLLQGGLTAAIAAEARFLQPLAQATPERRIEVPETTVAELLRRPRVFRFEFAPALIGELALSGKSVDGVVRITAAMRNLSPLVPRDREAALTAAMASLHIVLRARHGAWISLLDPPAAQAGEAQACARHGLYPVLAGTAGMRNTMLLSPIALADYPQVAPESPGDFFDGTEIDELLALRVLTLSDAERAELAQADPRVRELLQRIETLPPERLRALHGALRSPHAGDAALACGTRVRLHPRPGGDVMDAALDGRLATVTAVERDFDGATHVAVVLDDDPGADLGAAGFHGHRFFFTPSEVEPL